MNRNGVRKFTVLGFPKCGTTGFLKAMRRVDGVTVLRKPSGGVENNLIKLSKSQNVHELVADTPVWGHKFTRYVYRPHLLQPLKELDITDIYILFIRNQCNSLISWHNYYKNIANGPERNHSAYRKREFFGKCGIEEFYNEFGRENLMYHKYFEEMMRIIPLPRLLVFSQERMAQSTNFVVAETLRALGCEGLAPAVSEEDRKTHESFADRAGTELPPDIAAELHESYKKLIRSIEASGVRSYL